jgi:acetyl-CoA C-acetyltransferase
MPDAVIVSTARTPIGKAYRGAFNMTHGAELGGHVVKHAVARAGVDPAEVEDVILGCALPERATGGNIARQAAIRAGLPVTVAGMTVNRFCSSGLQSIASAQRIIAGEASVLAAGGLESISLVQDGTSVPVHDGWIVEHKPAIYMPMIDTADIVAERYKVRREAQDAYALESQRRTASAQQAKRFDDEIVPLPTTKKVVDKNTKTESFEPVTLTSDEGNRPDTTLEGLAALKPVREGKWITAGNASQLSDGASACVVMEAKLAERRGLEPLGTFRGFAVAGCEPDEMGIGPVLRGAQTSPPARIEHRQYRSVGIEGSFREPGALLPRPARPSAGAAQRRRRRDFDRPSVRYERRAHDRPRLDRR